MPLQPYRNDPIKPPARNAKCSCGSGLKAKKCCFGPMDYTRKTAPYMSMRDVPQLTASIEADHAFIRRWGYPPGLAERSVLETGTDDEMVDLVVRKLAALNAAPQWINAARELRMMITEMNVNLVSKEEAEAWNAVIGDTPVTMEKHSEAGCTCHSCHPARQ